VRKAFDTPDGVKLAVAGVDLDVYEGQIFALLGHNGAGKTTLLSILTGLIPPTSGDAWAHGLSINGNLAELRKTMGVCPQHDVLWPDLTVREHLIFFAGIKGVARDAVDAAVMAVIREVGLVEKINVLSADLSGGMKRKLSVGIALIGDSKLVFLDEPTSGMDPYSRRSTWNILQNARAGRIIILTTHFMDEADMLGACVSPRARPRAPAHPGLTPLSPTAQATASRSWPTARSAAAGRRSTSRASSVSATRWASSRRPRGATCPR
jgi:ATP-binding cassette subfamily A (ABC1) protein 3